ncbi:634_t:CDS:2 [Paraglomus occultum]|uniref:634_t:CDS:1 n=1 Tax=Paraglomus occultum TaxID=144539 RepID=A0A9N9BHE1_9GLOM|nr:634_t:CDS:2 [Paraglomus occultum]
MVTEFTLSAKTPTPILVYCVALPLPEDEQDDDEGYEYEFIDFGAPQMETVIASMVVTVSVALSLLVCYQRANRLIPNGIYFALQPRHTPDEDLSLQTGLLEEEDEDATQLDDRMLDHIRYRDDDDSIEDVRVSKNYERSLIDDSNKPTENQSNMRNDFGVFSIADEDDL